MKLVTFLSLFVLSTTVYAQQYFGGNAAPTWKTSVASAAALPASGNSVGDIRIETSGFVLYSWDGAAWIAISSPGAGTVTAVSVVSANGFSGTVANSSTTPAITMQTTVTGVLKGNGTAISAAVSGTDYQAPGNYITALTSDVAASGPGSVAATIQPNVVSNAKLAQMATNTIKGNNTGGTANATDLTVAQVNTMLGTMTSVSVASANGLAGSSSGGATPTLTLSTSVNGIVKGNGTAFSAAVANTDYQAPISTSSAPANQFATGFTAPNTFTYAQPAFSNLSGSISAAQMLALPTADIYVGDGSNQPAAVAVSGDASLASSGALTVNTVGTSSAANIHSAELAANAATSANTASTIVKRDGSGNFSAGTITASLSGNATNVTGVVAVANGGTSLNSLTANSIVVGNGAAAPNFLAPSTANNIIVSNGTNFVSQSPQATGVYYIAKNGADSVTCGSAVTPCLTIQQALTNFGDAAVAADVKKPGSFFISPGAYDESLTIPNGRIITLYASGTVVLGDGAGANWNSTTARSINWAVNTAAVFGSDIKPALNLIALPASDATSTFIAEAGNFTVSGNIAMTGDGLTNTFNLNGVKVWGNITHVNTALTNWQSYRSIVVGTVTTTGNLVLERAYDSRFNGLLSVNAINMAFNSNFPGGITVQAIQQNLLPNGIFHCNIAGTFTGPASSARFDPETDFYFTNNAASLAGGATKVLLANNSSATVTGLLSSTDWSTFNGKQNTISTSSAPANQFATGFTSPNTFTYAQPAFSNLSGSISAAQMLALPSADLYVGNGSNQPAAVAVSGDLTLANTGAFTIANNAVTNAKIANSTIDLTAKVTGTLPVANGGTNSATALNNNRVMESVAGAIVEAAAITANRALVSNASGLPIASSVTDTTLAFLDATSSVQTQLNGKQASGNYITALTGDVTASGPGSVAATVALVGGSTAANVHSAELAANAATATPTASTISKWDASSNMSANAFFTSTYEDFTEIATPANPSANHLRLYAKAGDGLYYLNSAGSEVQLSVGGGTVTSVALSAPAEFTVSGSPVTTSGTLTFTKANQSANLVYAGPTSGGAAAPTFRSLVSADIPSLSATYLPLTGGTMSGSINGGGFEALNFADPTISTSLATKSYVDNLINGLNWKAAAEEATAAALPANIYNNGASGVGATLTGVANGALTVDGVSPAVNDRLLIKNEVTASHNGIYTVTATGGIAALYVLTRATDYNQASELAQGDTVYVNNGTANSNTAWSLNTSPPYTIGTTSLSFVQVSGPGSLVAGTGISISGNTISTVSSTLVTVGSKTANYSVTTSDATLLGDATGGSFTFTLPTSASSFSSGRSNEFNFIKKDSSANTISISAQGADTIQGVATIILNTQYQSITVVTDGTGAFYVK